MDFEKGLTLTEIGEGISVEDVKAVTKCNFKVRVCSIIMGADNTLMSGSKWLILW